MRYPGFGLFPLMVVALAGCGSSDSSSTPRGSAAGSCDTVTISMLALANSDAKACSGATQCMSSTCSSAATECAGPDWATGNYAGLCPSFFACAKACNCDKDCVKKCNPDTPDCASCLTIKLAMGCSLTCMSSIAACGK